MTQLHVQLKSGERLTIVALADCEPNPSSQPPTVYPETIWASGRANDQAGAALHAHILSESVEAIWTTED